MCTKLIIGVPRLASNAYEHVFVTSLNKTGDAVEQFSSKLQEKVLSAKEDDLDFREEFAEETDLINARMESGVSGVSLD